MLDLLCSANGQRDENREVLYTWYKYPSYISPYLGQKAQSERLTWSLTPHSPAGAFAHKDSASPLLTLSERILTRQDLLLRRAMLAGLLPVYVDRFARAWHRLSTADAPEPQFHYREAHRLRQGGARKNAHFPLRRNSPGVIPMCARNTRMK